MPSPFPGMDPYLEAKGLWPDFHHAIAGEMRGILNETLPSQFYAQLEMRPEIGIGEEAQRSGVPGFSRRAAGYSPVHPSPAARRIF